jgi:predicted DNA-binding protein
MCVMQKILQPYNQYDTMSVMSIRVDEEKKKKLKAIASLQGKSMSSIIEGLIDQYIEDAKNENILDEEIRSVMALSEPSFDEWDNDEDEIYNEL